MSKIRPRNPEATHAARDMHGQCGIEDERDVDVRALSSVAGANFVFEPLVNQAAQVLTLDGRRTIVVSSKLLDTYLWRFDAAHEIGHVRLLHPLNELGLCTGELAEAQGARWSLERAASDFAVELLMAERFFRPLVIAGSDTPTFDLIGGLQRRFRMGRRSTAIRFVELSPLPCAVVVSVNGVVKWSLENHPFALRIVKTRSLKPTSRAAAMFRNENVAPAPARVAADAWHMEKRIPEVELWEQTIVDDEEPSATITLLHHAPIR